MSITTSTGTTVTVEPGTAGPIIVLSHPDAPADMRHLEAGRIYKGHFQPSPFAAAWGASPETLRAIADTIDAEAQA